MTNLANAPLSELHADFMELSSGSLATSGDPLCDAIRTRIGCATALKYALPSPLQATFDIDEMKNDLDIAMDLCRWAQLPPVPTSSELRDQIAARLAAKYGVTLTAATSLDGPPSSPLPTSDREPLVSTGSPKTLSQSSAPPPFLRPEGLPATPLLNASPSVHLLIEVVIRTPESTPAGGRS
jgi:hypothetical protein